MTYIDNRGVPSMHACMPVWYPECWSVCILIDSLNRIGKVSIKNKVVRGCCLGVWVRVGHFYFYSFLLAPSLCYRINGSVDGPSGQVLHLLLVDEGRGLGSIIFWTLIHTLEPIRSMCVEHYPWHFWPFTQSLFGCDAASFYIYYQWLSVIEAQ